MNEAKVHTITFSLSYLAVAGVALCLYLSPLSVYAAQFVLLDGEFDGALDGHGFAQFEQLGPPDGFNWQAGNYFPDGNVYMRYEMIENNGGEFDVQLCFWQGGNERCSSKETGVNVRSPEPQVYYDELEAPSTWWSKGSFNWGQKASAMRLVHRRGEGFASRADVKFKAQLIVVSAGSKLEPPANWVCPAEWECGGAQPAPVTNTTGEPVVPVVPLTGPCHIITGNSPLPQGFAAPYEVFSGLRTLMMKVTCLTTQAVFDIGTGSQLQYHYHQAHVWNGTAWQLLTLTGPTQRGVWFVGRAGGQLPLPEQGQQLFVVAYTCTFVTTAWKCGCRDQTCQTPMWQLQAYQRIVP